MSIDRPTINQFAEFSLLCPPDCLPQKKHVSEYTELLQSGVRFDRGISMLRTYSDNITTCEDNVVPKWLNEQLGFKNGWTGFTKKAFYEEWVKNPNLPISGISIEQVLKAQFTSICAASISTYLKNEADPDSIIIVTEKRRTNAIKPIEDVLKNMENGISPYNPREKYILTALLEDFIEEILEYNPSKYQGRQDAYLSQRYFTGNLAREFYSCYGENDQEIIINIISDYIPNVEPKTVGRSILAVEEYEEFSRNRNRKTISILDDFL